MKNWLWQRSQMKSSSKIYFKYSRTLFGRRHNCRKTGDSNQIGTHALFSGELPISASRGYWRVLFLFINESLWHHRPKEEIALIEASHFDRYAYLLFIRIFLRQRARPEFIFINLTSLSLGWSNLELMCVRDTVRWRAARREFNGAACYYLYLREAGASSHFHYAYKVSHITAYAHVNYAPFLWMWRTRRERMPLERHRQRVTPICHLFVIAGARRPLRATPAPFR